MIVYKYSPVEMPNDKVNTMNIIKTFNANRVIPYNHEELDGCILWIFCHGLFTDKVVKTFDPTTGKVEEKTTSDFLLMIGEKLYLESVHFPVYFKCKNCYIIIDSCNSNRMDLNTLSEFKEKNNLIFLSGYEPELNTFEGSTLNYCLYQYGLTHYRFILKDLRAYFREFNAKNKTTLVCF